VRFRFYDTHWIQTNPVLMTSVFPIYVAVTVVISKYAFKMYYLDFQSELVATFIFSKSYLYKVLALFKSTLPKTYLIVPSMVFYIYCKYIKMLVLVVILYYIIL